MFLITVICSANSVWSPMRSENFVYVYIKQWSGTPGIADPYKDVHAKVSALPQSTYCVLSETLRYLNIHTKILHYRYTPHIHPCKFSCIDETSTGCCVLDFEEFWRISWFYGYLLANVSNFIILLDSHTWSIQIHTNFTSLLLTSKTALSWHILDAVICTDFCINSS